MLCLINTDMSSHQQQPSLAQFTCHTNSIPFVTHMNVANINRASNNPAPSQSYMIPVQTQKIHVQRQYDFVQLENLRNMRTHRTFIRSIIWCMQKYGNNKSSRSTSLAHTATYTHTAVCRMFNQPHRHGAHMVCFGILLRKMCFKRTHT